MNTAALPNLIEARCFCANDIQTFDTCIIKIKLKNKGNIYFTASHSTYGNRQPLLELNFEKAKIIWDSEQNGTIKAYFKDNTVIDYGDPNTIEENANKLVKVARWISNPNENSMPYCNINTTIPFLTVIDKIFKSCEFKRFKDEEIIFDELYQRYYVKGLYEKLIENYNQN